MIAIASIALTITGFYLDIGMSVKLFISGVGMFSSFIYLTMFFVELKNQYWFKKRDKEMQALFDEAKAQHEYEYYDDDEFQM